jgi:ribonuclease VapC
MLVVHTSVVIAILRQEADYQIFQARINSAPSRYISVASLAEASLVEIGRKGREGTQELDVIVKGLGLMLRPVTEDMLPIMRDAFARYGKGQGHPAQLNFGDCFSYALAKAMQLPLLFKGNDFRHTDIMAAV